MQRSLRGREKQFLQREPQDWGLRPTVTANEQKPPKKRGRKPKEVAAAVEAHSSKGEKRKQSESKGPQSQGTNDTSTKKKKQTKIEETVMGDQTKHEEKDEVARAEGAAPSTKKRQRKQGDGTVEETEQAQPAKKAKKATLTKALANTRFQSTPRTKLHEIKAAAKAHSKLSNDFAPLESEGSGGPGEA